jgi:hypothetical protein
VDGRWFKVEGLYPKSNPKLFSNKIYKILGEKLMVHWFWVMHPKPSALYLSAFNLSKDVRFIKENVFRQRSRYSGKYRK